MLSVAPPTQTRRVQTAATVTAVLRNSGGPNCGCPLQGAIVKFGVLSGTNAGRAGASVTNSQGKATPIMTTPTKIPLGLLATIWLNRTIKTKTSITQRAVEIDLGCNVLLVLAQSQADFKGSPCNNT